MVGAGKVRNRRLRGLSSWGQKYSSEMRSWQLHWRRMWCKHSLKLPQLSVPTQQV